MTPGGLTPGDPTPEGPAPSGLTPSGPAPGALAPGGLAPGGLILDVLLTESSALLGRLRERPATDWSRPTRCRPWTARELLAHVRVVLGRVPAMLAAPAPPRATVSAAGYYRPDARFSTAANADRVALARTSAAGDPLSSFAATVTELSAAVRAAPPGRTVLTRHGDAMRLDDFLATRVVEVAVHGLDLADAVGVPAWLTPGAAGLVQELLLGPGRTAPDPEHFIRAATGRASDPDLLARLRPRPLTLG